MVKKLKKKFQIPWRSFIEQDVTSPEDWEEVKNQTLDKYNKIDVLVNNAGIAIIKPLEEPQKKNGIKQSMLI